MSTASAPRAYLQLPPPSGSPAIEWSAPNTINLGNNESRYGLSPRVVERVQERCRTLNLYADPACTQMRAAIAGVYGLPAAQICCGNGSEELLDLVGRLYARPGDEILFLEYGFFLYRVIALRTGATAVAAAVGPQFEISVDNVLSKVTPRTKIVYISNPENPTGRYLPLRELRRLREGLRPDVVLVIDAAYCEFVDDPDYSAGFELVNETRNVVVTRTFSKAFGLAGARAGWAYCPADMVPLLNRMRGIGNVNAIAQEGAIAALEDMAFVESVARRTIAERQRLSQALLGMGLVPIPSGTNFVLVRFPPENGLPAAQADEALRRAGIRVRVNRDHPLDGYLRITVGLPEDNDAVVAALRAAKKACQ